jgi:large repetitive protein
MLKINVRGGASTGKPFIATATVAGVNGQYSASLEAVTPILTYYAGSSASGRALPGPPVNAGTYTVVATFAGSKDYIRASTSASFTIVKAKAAKPKRR